MNTTYKPTLKQLFLQLRQSSRSLKQVKNNTNKLHDVINAIQNEFKNNDSVFIIKAKQLINKDFEYYPDRVKETSILVNLYLHPNTAILSNDFKILLDIELFCDKQKYSKKTEKIKELYAMLYKVANNATSSLCRNRCDIIDMGIALIDKR